MYSARLVAACWHFHFFEQTVIGLRATNQETRRGGTGLRGPGEQALQLTAARRLHGRTGSLSEEGGLRECWVRCGGEVLSFTGLPGQVVPALASATRNRFGCDR